VLPRYGKLIFVHGCFWHGHKGCPRSKRPITNQAFWAKKIDANIRRDRKVVLAAKHAGWDLLIVWQCETRDTKLLCRRLKEFLMAKQ